MVKRNEIEKLLQSIRNGCNPLMKAVDINCFLTNSYLQKQNISLYEAYLINDEIVYVSRDSLIWKFHGIV
jgi:hypothetical protein